MCGIYGILYKDVQNTVDPGLLQNMGSVLSHRGPDYTGIWINNRVGLGHTRLSIIDLSPQGNQPMPNENQTVWVTFNGEIYNFPELKEYLVKKGHQFRSRTDTEVLVHLWEEEGVECVQRLRGMFAFAVWDEAAQTLFLARDRVGKKPLFYANLADRFLFASEIKAILQDPSFDRRVDIEAIHHYLSYQSVPSPYCAFKGIQKLPPAHRLLIRSGDERPVRYWKLRYTDKLAVPNETAQARLQEELIERLREAIKIRLMSDVPLGAFLSGGIDSSIVTALMAGLMNQPVKTFSIGFDYDEYNELPYARLVAQRYHTDHHEFIVKPEALAILPELVWYYNEPFADSSAIPTFYVSKLAKQHVTVILNGDGGDENFAGYPRYTNSGDYAVKPGITYLLQRWVKQRSSLYAFIDPADGLLANLRRFIALNQQRLLYYYRITHFHELYKMQLYTPEMKQLTRSMMSVDIMLEKYRSAEAQDFLDATLSVDFGLYLPDTLMPKVDVASMAYSLEARSPLLDHQFMEFAARIPADLKLRNGQQGKYIFKKAVAPYLPPEIINRPKMGFGVPIDHWFRNELRDMVFDTLLSTRALQRGYFRKSYIEHMLQRHQQGEQWQYLIWNLLMLELWHLMFIDRTFSPPAGIPCSPVC